VIGFTTRHRRVPPSKYPTSNTAIELLGVVMAVVSVGIASL
jgi:hypothetical protein